jgi:DNA-binding MarR family transcriptional regulator
VTELAEALGSGLPAMSRLVGRLRDRALVLTAKDARDGRITVVRLAPQGRRLRTAILARRSRTLEAAMRSVDPAEAAVDLIGHVADAFEAEGRA